MGGLSRGTSSGCVRVGMFGIFDAVAWRFYFWIDGGRLLVVWAWGLSVGDDIAWPFRLE